MAGSLTLALRTAQSGLLVNQQALDIVANNIANVNSPGYSRKTVSTTPQIVEAAGAGVKLAEVQRQIDQNLLKSLRIERGSLNRHFPANLQIHGNRIYIAPPRELHSLRSPPMTRLWRADHVRKAIWQRFPPSRHTSPVFSTLPSISSAYAGTGLRRRSSIKAKIFWNKIFDTATSASWNVT